MKIFILLILISCGKEQTFKDSQFFSNPVEIEGSLEFMREKSILPFRSYKETEKEIYSDLFRTSESVQKKTEYERIDLDNFDIPEGEQFELKLKSNLDLPLLYIDGKLVRPLNAAGFTLSKSDLLNLNKKKSFLSFQIAHQSLFKRVTVLEHGEVKSYLIYKDELRLPFEARNITAEDIFHGTDLTTKWYKKVTPEGNILLVSVDSNFLRETFLNTAKKTKSTLLRSDGHPQNEITFNEGMHLLKITPNRFFNALTKTRETEFRHESRCYYEKITITSQYTQYVDFKTLESELLSPFSDLVNFRKIEENSPNGTIWYVSFYVAKPTNISFNVRPPSTFFSEGEQGSRCRVRQQTRNYEAKFNLEIESYLEPEL